MVSRRGAAVLLAAAALPLARPVRSGRRVLRVSFVNPGRADEALWLTIEESMRHLAPRLDIELRVAQTGRNRVLMRSEGLAAIAATPRPDLLLIGNEERSAREVILAAEGRGVPCFLLLNDLDGEDAEAIGAPRGQVRAYLGSLMPDNVAAGRLQAELLLAAARARRLAGPDGRIRLLAIVGDRVTPASTLREDGLHRALAAAPDVALTRVLPGNWSEQAALAMAERYIAWARTSETGFGTDLVWAANDPMALGALSAFAAAGATPGQDVLFGGVNWTAPALDAVAAGRMETSLGGHVFAGVMALLVLRDWADGRDFAEGGEARLRMPLFPVGRDQAAGLQALLREAAWARIDAAALARQARGPSAPALPSVETIVQALVAAAR